MQAYDEIVDFIASGPSVGLVAEFQASPELKQRVGELISLQMEDRLLPEEQAELNHFLELEHLMRLAKARARERLGAHA